MQKMKHFPRVLSMVLAFCLSVALLPAQAFAATKDDDPTTWPAPDSIYTAPGKNPVYLMVDFTDEDNGGIAASHYCVSGATMTADIVKATAATGGHVKYTCDNCGSWARINVPALTLSAFTLDPAYNGIMTTGVEYSGDAYTVVYNVAPAFQRYVGTKLDNHVSVTAPGSYGIIITVDSAIYDKETFAMRVATQAATILACITTSVELYLIIVDVIDAGGLFHNGVHQFDIKCVGEFVLSCALCGAVTWITSRVGKTSEKQLEGAIKEYYQKCYKP